MVYLKEAEKKTKKLGIEPEVYVYGYGWMEYKHIQNNVMPFPCNINEKENK